MAASATALDVAPDDETVYQPRDAVAVAIRDASITGAGGLLMSAVQNTVLRQNVGAFGIVSKFGGTTALFATIGGVYGFTHVASANLREKQDFWSQVHAGLAAGALLGLRNRSMPSVVGNALMVGAGLGAISYTGGTIFNSKSSGEPDLDKAAYKEEMRRRFRRPVNEIVNEIGEGRGIYPPGYEERRRERIKAAYGIDVAEQPYYKGVSAANHS